MIERPHIRRVPDEPMVQRAMFDEAIRVGEKSATMASKHMQISRTATEAIAQALVFIKSGRIDKARDRLDRALAAITKMSAL